MQPGRAPVGAGLEIDGCAEMGADRDLQTVVVSLQPGMRFSGAQSDGENMRVARVDLVDNVIRTHFLDAAETREQCARANHPAVLSVDVCCGGGGDALRSAEEEHFQRLRETRVFKQVEQIRACHPLFHRNAQQSAEPDDWHPVRCADIARYERVLNSESRRLVAR